MAVFRSCPQREWVALDMADSAYSDVSAVAGVNPACARPTCSRARLRLIIHLRDRRDHQLRTNASKGVMSCLSAAYSAAI